MFPLALLILLHSCPAHSQDLNFSFSDFYPNEPSLDVGPQASIQYGAVQITFDTGTSSPSTINSSGRITHSQGLRFSDPKYNYTASFHTSFDLNIEPLNGGGQSDATGGGMAFILSSHRALKSDAVANSFGQWLGLFNSSLNATPDASVQQLVAIEFDTFKDSFDPDSNHIGIDVSSPVSLVNESLTLHSVFLNNNETNTSVWIDYDGHAKLLDVYVANFTKIKPVKPVLSYPIDLSLYLPNQIYVGFAGSTGTTLETHCVLAWNFTSQSIPGGGNGRWKIGVAVGVTAAVVILVVLGASFVVRHRRARTLSKTWKDLNYGPRNFTYSQLRRATQNFSESCLIGKGGFGEVYKGTMPSDKSKVAVKRISPKSKQGEREFIAEVTTIGRLRHKNLVQLLGWCHDNRGKLLLVYEYMPNGSLDQWLRGGEGREEMGWERRYNVMRGIAAGLLYLHEEWEMGVVHRDLKPSNVMLDGEWNAKLGDFGLARLIEGGVEGLETRNIAGTPGYMAPESIETVVTKEADVYSFGAVAMEVATGRRPSSELSRWLWSLYEEERLLEAADPRLSAYNAAEVKRLLLLGLACCHPLRANRPSIGKVLQALSSPSASLPPLWPLPSPLSLPSDDSGLHSSSGGLSLSSIATCSTDIDMPR